MVLETIATAAAGYFVNAFKNTKGVTTALDELSSAFWNTVRPWLIEDVPATVAAVEQKPQGGTPPVPVAAALPEAAAQQSLAEAFLKKAIADAGFARQLEELFGEKGRIVNAKNYLEKPVFHAPVSFS